MAGIPKNIRIHEENGIWDAIMNKNAEIWVSITEKKSDVKGLIKKSIPRASLRELKILYLLLMNSLN